MVPKRSPWVQMSSAQPRTSRSISAGQGVGGQVEVVGLGRARRAGKRASRTEPADQIEGPPGRGKAARPPPRWPRHRGGTARAPTWTAPAHGSAPSTLCLCRRAGPGPPSARSQWLSQPWSARVGAGAAGSGASRRARPAAPLVLTSQTPWVTADQPWFNLDGRRVPAASGRGQQPVGQPDLLRAAQRRLRSAAGDLGHARRRPGCSARPASPSPRVAGGLAAATCVTWCPTRAPASPPPGTASARPARRTFTLGCTPLDGRLRRTSIPCPSSLVRQGSSTPVARFTTFLTYQQPTRCRPRAGPLRVGVVVPVTAERPDHHGRRADRLPRRADHARREPAGRQRQVDATRARDGMRGSRPAGRAAAATRVIDQPYVPINLAALTGAGLSGEIGAQISRGDDILRDAGLKPDGGPWVDTSSDLSQGDAANLASGLQLAGRHPGRGQRRRPGLGRGEQLHVRPALHARPRARLDHPGGGGRLHLSARFTATPANPVLGAEQLLAGLSFVHFENAFLSAPRGVVVVPPAGWQPSAAFMDALLAGLSPANPALKAVTLSQLFAAGARGRQPRAGGAPAPVRIGRPRHHAQRGRPHRARPPAAGLLQPGRGRAPGQPDDARRHALDHRGARPRAPRAAPAR